MESGKPDLSWCKQGGARGYVVLRDLRWDIGRKGSGHVLIVPAGTEFESSVPRGLRWLFSPHDPHFLKAAAVHDTLLEDGWRYWSADSQWFEAALSEQAPTWKAAPAYIGMVLRRFGLWALGRASFQQSRPSPPSPQMTDSDTPANGDDQSGPSARAK